MNYITDMKSLAFFLLLVCLPPQNRTVTYRWQYPYVSRPPEDQFIVWDTVARQGWYYGTTDEFDQAREGYVPGFFVAAMKELQLNGDSISFVVAKPTLFFMQPVPRSVRDAATHKAARWSGARLDSAMTKYRGIMSRDSVVLGTGRDRRVFRVEH